MKEKQTIINSGKNNSNNLFLELLEYKGLYKYLFFQIAKQMAKKFNINESGYRTVFNCNNDGGQSVDHIHLHLIGGRLLNWPPG